MATREAKKAAIRNLTGNAPPVQKQPQQKQDILGAIAQRIGAARPRVRDTVDTQRAVAVDAVLKTGTLMVGAGIIPKGSELGRLLKRARV